MKDYSCYTVLEAASREIIEHFVDHIKQSDSEIIKKRLQALVTSDYRSSFTDIAAQFNSVIGTRTSAD